MERRLQGVHLHLFDLLAHRLGFRSCQDFRNLQRLRKSSRRVYMETLTPGVMVPAMVIEFTKFPFTADGLAWRTCSTNTVMFSASLSSSKLILPTPACTLPPLSVRYSTLPALNSRTAAAISPPAVTTVPALGVGIRPRGPSTLPSLLTTPIISWVAKATSNSSQPPCIFFTKS